MALLVASAVLLLSLFAPSTARALLADIAKDGDAFVGWEGETYRAQGEEALGIQPYPEKSWIEVVSWHPRAFVYHNFMTDEECLHIIQQAAIQMKRSTVVGANGSSVLDDYRTSFGTFLRRNQDPIIRRVEERVAQWAKIPLVHAEDMQVLRYGVGQYYKKHMDSLRDEDAGPRVATILLYFNDVEEGGETAFPDGSRWVDPSMEQRFGPFSECANGSVAFKPRKGSALMFWSITPDGDTEDPFSMHTGCPVLKGFKWTGTKWLHARPFRPESYSEEFSGPSKEPGLCEDAQGRACARWAAAGECTTNQEYMIGSQEPGQCMRACGACEACEAGDRACLARNRRKLGYLVIGQQEATAIGLPDIVDPDVPSP